MISNNDYWNANITLIIKCLSVWFVVAYLFGIVFAEELNAIHIGGYKLGFWFAQQGSIYTFLVLIFYYAKKMDEIDEKFNNQN